MWPSFDIWLRESWYILKNFFQNQIRSVKRPMIETLFFNSQNDWRGFYIFSTFFNSLKRNVAYLKKKCVKRLLKCLSLSCQCWYSLQPRLAFSTHPNSALYAIEGIIVRLIAIWKKGGYISKNFYINICRLSWEIKGKSNPENSILQRNYKNGSKETKLKGFLIKELVCSHSTNNLS